jgi:hypothetical protein
MAFRSVQAGNGPAPEQRLGNLRCRRPVATAWLGSAAGLLFAGGLILGCLPASAQQYMQVWPGLRDTNGPSIEIETEDNVRCRFTHGARPSFSVAGLSTNPSNGVDGTFNNDFNNYNSSSASQLGGGLLLSIPFGGTRVDSCAKLTNLQEQRSRLSLASTLLEQGLITQEQFQQLGSSIAKQLGITGPSPSGGTSTKPVYVSPPPLNTGAGANPAAARPPAGQSGGAAYSQRFPPLNTGAGAGPSPGMPAGAN